MTSFDELFGHHRVMVILRAGTVATAEQVNAAAAPGRCTPWRPATTRR